MASKNQMVGQRGAESRNEDCNGGIRDCCRKHNAANVGAMWKTKGKYGPKGKRKLRFDIKSTKGVY